MGLDTVGFRWTNFHGMGGAGLSLRTLGLFRVVSRTRGTGADILYFFLFFFLLSRLSLTSRRLTEHESWSRTSS